MFHLFRSRKSTPRKTDTQLQDITIQGHSITLEIRKSNQARRISIGYRPGQAIRVTAPYRTPDSTISYFVQQHHDRILQHHLCASDSLIASNPDLCDHSREHFLTHRQSALEFCTRKVEQRNKDLGWKYSKITVKSLKTKRGSCSSKGNLNFNYKLMFLPEPMADYIIVHELCHLREMNHGPRFWKLVEQVYGPEWRQYKKIM